MAHDWTEEEMTDEEWTSDRAFDAFWNEHVQTFPWANAITARLAWLAGMHHQAEMTAREAEIIARAAVSANAKHDT